VLALEHRLSDLVDAAYGPTQEEVARRWRTAPPRMPLGPKEELHRLGARPDGRPRPRWSASIGSFAQSPHSRLDVGPPRGGPWNRPPALCSLGCRSDALRSVQPKNCLIRMCSSRSRRRQAGHGRAEEMVMSLLKRLRRMRLRRVVRGWTRSSLVSTLRRNYATDSLQMKILGRVSFNERLHRTGRSRAPFRPPLPLAQGGF